MLYKILLLFVLRFHFVPILYRLSCRCEIFKATIYWIGVYFGIGIGVEASEAVITFVTFSHCPDLVTPNCPSIAIRSPSPLSAERSKKTRTRKDDDGSGNSFTTTADPKMKFFIQVCLSAGLLLSQCTAFSPITSTSRQTTVVRDAIRSQWTMMPDEPTPEVGHFHVFDWIFWCFGSYNLFCLLRCNY